MKKNYKKTTTAQIAASKQKRNTLISLSDLVKSMIENEELEAETCNEGIKEYYMNKEPEITKFNTFKGWKDEGYSVKKGAKAYLVWGKKREVKKTDIDESETETEKKYKFFPVSYIFSNLQVASHTTAVPAGFTEAEPTQITIPIIKEAVINMQQPTQTDIFTPLEDNKKYSDNTYEERKKSKIGHYKELAEKNDTLSTEHYEASKKLTENIPFGQPILVGHHSEKKHRNTIDKSWNKMNKSIECNNKAKHYQNKAETAEKNNSISSDDPAAIEKISIKINTLKQQQEFMKNANKARKKGKDEYEKYCDNNTSPFKTLKYVSHDSEKPYATWTLTNNNANIRRLEKRLKELKSKAEMGSSVATYGEIEIVRNVEANRVQIIFPYKPDDAARKELKSKGFRWSPRNTAWQASLQTHYINRAIDIVEAIIA